MQTRISEKYKSTIAGQRAEEVLRSCVHCGFCTATCPTYQLLGDELDSPRGRIYLIKQMLEGNKVSKKTQNHLDRCLTCRSCETTCPSGVEYSHLLEIGRELVEKKVSRTLSQQATRWLLRNLLAYKKRFAFLLGLGRLFRPLLPASIKQSIPKLRGNLRWAAEKHNRKMIILDGCVQPSLSPQINATTSRVLSKLGIEVITHPLAQCCGAVNQHLNDTAKASQFIRLNIDAWYPLIEAGDIEAIVITASGCGAMVKEYAHIMQDDPDYAEKAKRISTHCKDISEILVEENLSRLQIKPAAKIAFHSPCTLQHAQKLDGLVESLLTKVGFELAPVNNAHLCCGSAGTYSILQPEISQQLKKNKLSELQQQQPDLIATANIGCLHHLASGTDTNVVHWIELLD